MDALRQAIMEKLVEMGRIPPELMAEWMKGPTEGEALEMDQMLDDLIRQMVDEGWMQERMEGDAPPQPQEGGTY